MSSQELLDTIISCYRRALETDLPDPQLQGLPGIGFESKYRNFIFFLIQTLKYKHSVELGTDNGTTACFMGQATEPGQKVTTVELFYRQDAADQIARFPRITYLRNTSSLMAVNKFQPRSIGLLFMDTDHTEYTTWQEHNQYKSKMEVTGIQLVDDIMLFAGMRRFWGRVKCPKFVVNKLHTTHQGNVQEDGNIVAEGTGFGIIIPYANPNVGANLPEHPIIGGKIIE